MFSDASAEATTGQLDFGEMAGIFIIFAGFIGVAVVALVLECIYAAYSDKKKDREQVC